MSNITSLTMGGCPFVFRVAIEGLGGRGWAGNSTVCDPLTLLFNDSKQQHEVACHYQPLSFDFTGALAEGTCTDVQQGTG